eukprot:s481_g25.t1
MVKDSKLWYEIQAQYAKLQEDEVGAELFPTAVTAASPSSHSPSASTAASASEEKSETQTSRFYKDGFQRRHWVLACCSMMVMCEWLDRTVLSIAMESMKEDFKLTDAQVGLLASASLWIVPFATGCVGRLADHVPRARLIGAGVFGWAVATFATGSSPSFEVTLLSRLLAGVANCAGYPVTLALLSDYFAAEEMATAMGYYHAGSALGGLMGFAAGGVLVTSRGWRWAFWVVASPQVIVALLFCFTVPRTAEEGPPKEGVCSDVRQLLALRPLRLLMLGATCTGMLSGQGRFLSAFTERRHGVEAAQIGLVMGPVLGVTGVVSSFVIGHLVDRVFRRRGDLRVNLWFATFGDVLGMLCGVAAILGPSFAVLIFFTALGVVVGCFRQGVQAVVQRLGVGRRGTAQGLLETCWSIGMGIGPFLAGELSDFNLAPDCDDSCALSRALMLFGSFSLLGRAACNFAASMFLSDLGIPAAEGRSSSVQNPRLMRKDAQFDDGWALLLQVTANGSLLQEKQMPAVMNPAAGMGGMSTGMANGMSMGQGNVPFAMGTSDDNDDEEEKKSTTTPAPTTAAATTAAATTAAPTTAAATTAAATTVAGTTKESEEKEKNGEGKASNSSGANATPPVIVSAAAPPAGSKEEAAQAQAERSGGGGGLTWLMIPVIGVLLVVAGIFGIKRWRERADRQSLGKDRRSSAEDERRKSMDAQTVNKGYKKNLRSSKLEAPTEAPSDRDAKAGRSGGADEAGRRSSYRERRSKSNERSSPSPSEGAEASATLKPGASPGYGGRRGGGGGGGGGQTAGASESPVSADAASPDAAAQAGLAGLPTGHAARRAAAARARRHQRRLRKKLRRRPKTWTSESRLGLWSQVSHEDFSSAPLDC